MHISIVIPNFNGANLLKESFSSVTKSLEHAQEKHISSEVLYIDDASSDESVQMITDLIKSYTNASIPIRLIKKEKNSGFAGTVNTGVTAARGEIVVLLNTDVFPKKDFLDTLLPHFIENKQIFAVGCLDESVEGEKIVERGRGVGRWERGFLLHRAGRLDKTNTLWVSGGSGAFRREIWTQLGGLQLLYSPYYWEDIDMSYRAMKSGYTILFEPKSIVRHEHEKGSIKKTSSDQQVKAIAYRNQFYFVWLNITEPFFLLSHLLWLPYHILTAFLRGDSAFFRGFIAAFGNVKPVLSERKNVKKLFNKSDKEVLAKVAS